MRTIVVLLGLTLFAAVVRPAGASVPRTLNYQGVLSNPSGVPLEGPCHLTFKLYQAEVGGSPLWTEIDSLSVTHGIFNAILGTRTALELPFDQTYWLGITVEDGSELSPRSQLTSSPYALRAAVASTVAGGVLKGSGAAESLVKFVAADSVGGSVITESSVGNLGVGTSTPTATLHLHTPLANLRLTNTNTGTTSSDGIELAPPSGGSRDAILLNREIGYLALGSSNTERVRITSSGRVGIGTTTPSGDLDVVGTVRMDGFCMPTNASAGYVLTTNANGDATWQATGTGTAWNLTGNAGTTPGTNFVGTTDFQALELKAGGSRILRLEPSNGNSPSLIGGSSANYLTPGISGATIGGGGTGGASANHVIGDWGTVSGGLGNEAAEFAVVSGGDGNVAGNTAAVGGGMDNTASGRTSVVAGGEDNTANSDHAAIGGGGHNVAGNACVVAGGLSNTANSTNGIATVGGGAMNHATADGATVGGGNSNNATAWNATVGGGIENQAGGKYATIPGGYYNVASGDYSIAMGRSMTVSGNNSCGINLSSGSGYTLSQVNTMAVVGGKLGIGTVTPGDPLDVAGNINATGTIKVTGFRMTPGTAGYVLTSDGSGNGSWGPVSGGGGDITGVYADNGLTGGATTGDAHLNVGAGDGIDVAADAVAVDVTDFAGSGLGEEGTNDLKVNTGSGLEISVDAVQLTSAYSSGSAYDTRFLNQSTSDAMSANASGAILLTLTNTSVNASSHGLWVTSGQGSNSWATVTRGIGGGGGLSSAATGWHGLHTTTSSPMTSDAGIYATNTGSGWAGYFSGNVNVTGTLSKGGGAFKIDHPLDPEHQYLYHSFVESPDMKNIYDGVVVLDGTGEAWVEMPAWFEALNQDFRYQLTAMGAPGPNLFIAQEVAGNRFKIAGGASGMKVSWQVTGTRHDKFAEAHRIPVEEPKPAAEQGKYLHPEAWGLPTTTGVTYGQDHLGEDLEH